MRVVRVYHAGRDAAHRARERALAALGVDVTLVVPSNWPDPGAQAELTDEPFEIVEMDVERAGDVNRHVYADSPALRRLVAARRPDILDIHEEPVSLASRQWLGIAGGLPVVMYTAQNIDKRFPPPFAHYEAAAYRRVDGLYPCSRQAASVARGKGFTGRIDVLPLGIDDVYSAGDQRLDDDVLRLAIVGRLVPEKGILDAIDVVARLRQVRNACLVVVGSGPEETAARAHVSRRGLDRHVEFLGWQPARELAALYRTVHVLLVPSRSSETWVEQFGRIIPEGQASGAVVAAYASGSIPEVGGSAALLVPEGDLVALSDTVTALVADPPRYAALRQAGIDRAGTMTWAAVAQQQAKLYERVLAGAEPRLALPREGAARRAIAEREFGSPALLPGGVRRPFAVPVLRRDNHITRAAGATFDTALRLLGR